MNGKTGHLMKITDNLNNAKNREYEFDVLGRLTKAKGGLTGNLWDQAYSYDRWGNRLTVAVRTGSVAADGSPMPADGIPNLAYDNTSNRITTAGYQYDVNGNMIRSLAEDGVTWVKYEYDAANRLNIIRKDDAGLTQLERFQYDQLGRVRLSRTLENIATEDPYNEQHGIKVETRYSTGNPNSYQITSNPFRAAFATQATNEPTMGWTRSKSWNTGRKSEVETFSGSALPAPWGTNPVSTGIITTDIDADRTLVTDQAGKQRISKTNALGQLKEVWEILSGSETGSESVSFPNTGIAHGFRTAYSYDTLNNLTTVNQGVQTRAFTYDSLSRLLTATNPESGLISYVYDNNGNLTSKVDARGVKTDYVYDALNRVTNRNYSLTGATPPNYQATPNVSYTYDNLPNAKGKLAKVTNGTGTDRSTTEYTAFDILGRVTASRQTTDNATYGNGTTDSLMTYGYNLSGALIEQQYPSGRKVQNVLDADGSLELAGGLSFAVVLVVGI